MKAGAALWTNSDVTTVTINNASPSIGTVVLDDTVPNELYAITSIAQNPSNGHIISFAIYFHKQKFNSLSTDVIKRVVAHEFGHIIGLKSLSYSYNANKIMYGNGSLSSAIAPSTMDIRGARLITGSHTSHTWGYRYYGQNVAGHNLHYKRCTYCHGAKYNSVEECTYNASGVCTKCGTPQGDGTQSIGLPEVIGMSLWEEQRRAFRFLV